MDNKYIMIVGGEGDPLSTVVMDAFRNRDIAFFHTEPEELGNLRVKLESDTLVVDDRKIAGIFYRSPIDSSFCKGFAFEDQSFCDAEIRATLLAAMHLPSILSINKYDEFAWFESGDWLVWRGLLLKNNVPVSPFAFGGLSSGNMDLWLPYTTWRMRKSPGMISRRLMGLAMPQNLQADSNIVVCSEIITGKERTSTSKCAQVLCEHGILIAQIATDSEEKIVSINTQPLFSNANEVRKAAELIVEAYDHHLHSR